MKTKFFMLLVAMLLSASVFAQDVIVKNDGSTIMSIVLEVGTSEIKYKKFSNQDGPTYTISRSEVMSINYKNGEKEDFTKKKDVELKDDIDSKEYELRAGTPIPIQNVTYVKAADLYVGQNVDFRVSQDVRVDDVTLIPNGTIVKGVVYEAKKSSGFGTKGRLGIRVAQIALPNGGVIPVKKGDIYVTGKNRTPLSEGTEKVLKI